MSGLSVYAEDHGLTATGKPLRAVTPLLEGGGGESSGFEGELAGGLRGTLAHHGGLTAVVGFIPETTGYVRALSCRSRDVSVDRSYRKLEHIGGWKEQKLESSHFNDAFSLEVIEAQRQGWVFQVFSPAFIAWLADRAPEGISFELNEGHLCVAAPRRIDDPAELDALCEAAQHVASRLSEEAHEESVAEAYAGDRELEERLRKQMGKVDWKQPPASVQASIGAYASEFGAGIVGWLKALLAFVILAGGGAAAAVFIPLGIVGRASALAVGVGIGFVLFVALRQAAANRRATRVGLEAWVHEYARANGYELEDRRRFHAAHRGLPLPGVAQHAMRGTIALPGGRQLPCELAFCADDAQMFSRGEQIAYTLEDGQPLASDVLVVELPGDGDLPEDASELARGEKDGAGSSQLGRELAVWEPLAGSLLRSTDSVNGFLTRATARIEAAFAAQER